MITENKRIGTIYVLALIVLVFINIFFINMILSIVTSILLLIMSLLGIKLYVNAKTEDKQANKSLLSVSTIILFLSILWIIANIVLQSVLYLFP